MTYRRQGFTIVEVLITIVVLGILTTITVVVNSNYMQTSRDAQRSANATTVAESLERYYESNGEYPSVRSIVSDYSDNDAQTVAERLDLGDLEILAMPGSDSANSIRSPSGARPGDLVYEATSTSNNDACQNDIDGGCDSFTLRYHEEETEEEVAIVSRRSDGVVLEAPEVPEQGPVPNAPSTPSNTVSTSGSTSTWSWNASCSAGSVGYQYRFGITTDLVDVWWDNWIQTSSTTYDTDTSTEGIIYVVEVQARCTNSSGSSAWSDINMAGYYRPISIPSAPSTPSNSVSTSGSTSTWSWNASCSAGNVDYQYRVSTGSYGSWTTTANTSYTMNTSAGGVTYSVQVRARCTNSSGSSAWSSANTTSYYRPLSVPSTPEPPYLSRSSNDGNLTSIWTWSADCSTGSVGYRFRFMPGGMESWVITSSTSYTMDTSAAGYTYSVQVQARCTNSSGSSAWSDYRLPITSYTRFAASPGVPDTPATPSNSVSTSGNTSTWSWSASCSTGTISYQYRYGITANLVDVWWGNWTSISSATYATDTSTEGIVYVVDVQARCTNSSGSSSWSDSATAAYYRPVSEPMPTTPAVPTITATVQYGQGTWTWSASCPVGSTEYRFRHGTTYSTSYTFGSWNVTSGTSYVADVSGSGGGMHVVEVQARCKNSTGTSSWSSVKRSNPITQL